jgi:hypothetical protein
VLPASSEQGKLLTGSGRAHLVSAAIGRSDRPIISRIVASKVVVNSLSRTRNSGEGLAM